jgi:hypothetical protein
VGPGRLQVPLSLSVKQRPASSGGKACRAAGVGSWSWPPREARGGACGGAAKPAAGPSRAAGRFGHGRSCGRRGAQLWARRRHRAQGRRCGAGTPPPGSRAGSAAVRVAGLGTWNGAKSPSWLAGDVAAEARPPERGRRGSRCQGVACAARPPRYGRRGLATGSRGSCRDELCGRLHRVTRGTRPSWAAREEEERDAREEGRENRKKIAKGIIVILVF